MDFFTSERMRRQDAGGAGGRGQAQGRAARPSGFMPVMSAMARPDVSLPPALGEDIALFHDLDGSLLELASRPEAVKVAPYLPVLLTALHRRLGGALAIVSGRQIQTLDRLLYPLRLAGAGLHGAELRRDLRGSIETTATAGSGDLPEALRRYFSDDPRIVIEDKGMAVAVHFRLAPERAAECEAVAAALASAMGLSATQGKMVIEVLPPEVNKGQAVQALMTLPPFAGRRPVFVGDDLTDENGILVAQAMGGYGIKVGAGPSVAHYRLGSVPEVHGWLAAGAGLRDFA
ncbi:trehalose-phosphatase [Solimonas sp. K1W22B-7]|uniref:trehalose-phosphatase n=1 Tax=Solimonas sp. K1W22B-7 TaxID=2303331 RepID=UPI000E330854|nr:trehalose-phosphatase [Solimonas sp. K1W22B-7]AXQ27369.1 trehalose-phosphatase [Solimonas sp. K1W22B-7]